MVSNVSPEVVLPSTGGVALDEPNTRLMHDLYPPLIGQRIRGLLGVAGLLVVFYLMAYRPLMFLLWPVVAVTILAAANLPMLVVERLAIRRILPDFPWRALPVTIWASGTLCVLHAPDDVGELLLRTRMNATFQQAVARTGRVWLCGLDKRGRGMVRVAGSLGLYPVRRVTSAPRRLGPVVEPTPTGPRPVDEPAVTLILRRLRRQRAFAIVIPCVAVALVAANWLVFPPQRWETPVVIFALACIVLMALAAISRSRSDGRTIRALRRAMAWHSVPFTMGGWVPVEEGRRGHLHGVAVLPDGVRLAVKLPSISTDLAANIRATGTLWLLDEPTAGTTAVAGLPDYPHFGTATIG